jgi:hypothetical protein
LVRAQANSVGSQAVEGTLITEFGRVLQVAVATVTRKQTTGLTGSVTAVIFAVIALFGTLLETVATIRA